MQPGEVAGRVKPRDRSDGTEQVALVSGLLGLHGSHWRQGPPMTRAPQATQLCDATRPEVPRASVQVCQPGQPAFGLPSAATHGAPTGPLSAPSAEPLPPGKVKYCGLTGV
ncbi:hypothetical protein NDU88_003135 [Pleurodeles waltl]|uniref:Uncharacterized protein n=1 Tax=Pleurodeles waltl TaxID=8319 RepID=A0AAV7RFY9_PLEWA|nr:hypothetical protein NDU88_003135 [Pleurodeles waltl]